MLFPLNWDCKDKTIYFSWTSFLTNFLTDLKHKNIQTLHLINLQLFIIHNLIKVR